MEADILNLKKLFKSNVRFVIPLFQRPYVWNQEKQWEPLWDDIRNTAERYLDDLTGSGADPHSSAVQAKIQDGAQQHFLGAVVLQQRLSAAAELETRDVIDGQQRLTTLQLLVDAVRHVVREAGYVNEAKLLRRVVRNTDVDDEDDVLKLLPTQLDQVAFRAAMNGEDETDDADSSDSRIRQAHAFFRLQVRGWIAEAPDDTGRALRAHAIATALLVLLQVVVIGLSHTDDAAVIFETLNARGTSLPDSDLVKNFVLAEAARAGHDKEVLYQQQWKKLDDPWWREDVRQGRIVRPRLDTFLNYWLTVRGQGEVQTNKVSSTFQDYVKESGRPVVQVVADLVAVGAQYRRLETDQVPGELQPHLARLKVTEIGAVTPVLLLLFSLDASRITPEQRLRCVVALESFLVRRMVCRMTTKDYNRLFLELIARLNREGDAPDGVLVDYLAAQQAEGRMWPDDRALETAFVGLPLYKLLTRGRLRMVLGSVEERLKTAYGDGWKIDYDALTIEHIMPRAWQKNWVHPANAHDRIERDRLVHTAGNLTLITGKLNSAQSNGPWPAKRDALNKHTVLYLNKQLISDYGRDWNEGTIRARGRALAAEAETIWPSAAAMTR